MKRQKAWIISNLDIGFEVPIRVSNRFMGVEKQGGADWGKKHKEESNCWCGMHGGKIKKGTSKTYAIQLEHSRD